MLFSEEAVCNLAGSGLDRPALAAGAIKAPSRLATEARALRTIKNELFMTAWGAFCTAMGSKAPPLARVRAAGKAVVAPRPPPLRALTLRLTAIFAGPTSHICNFHSPFLHDLIALRTDPPTGLRGAAVVLPH